MNILQSILLGIVQGLTEFLPVSSSAHLVLVPYLLNWKLPEEQVFLFDVLVQMGTLAAVIIYFWRDLWMIIRAWVQGLIQKKPFESSQARLGWYLILATIPAGLAGVLIKDKIEAAFNSVQATAGFLFLTAVFLVTAELIGKRNRSTENLNWLDALVIGVFQAISVFPGVSRSGSTITGGMARNFDRPTSARFSFLMSIPVMLAAGLMATLDLFDRGIAGSSLPVFIPGILAAGIIGYISIRWLIGYLTRHSLYIFAIYVAVLGAVVLFISLSQPQTRLTPEAGEIYTVTISSDAAYLESGLRMCSEKSSDALFINSAGGFSPGSADLALTMSIPADLPAFAAQVDDQAIVIIVNPENLAESLSLADLQAFFSGSSLNWPSGEAISVWSYPDGSVVRAIFDIHILTTRKLSSQAQLAPGPKQMVEAIGKDPAAIGYVPAAWVNEDVRIIDVDMPVEMHLPVLALAASEPEGSLRDWLACLDTSSYDTYLPFTP